MLNEFYEVIGYKFKNEAILSIALTHKSVHQDMGISQQDNERLEFIGDAYLDAVIGFELYDKLKDSPEGELTKKRALIVCEKSLASVAKKLNLSKYMIFGHSAIQNKVNEKDSVLADCVEAIIGAIYVDSGYLEVKNFILRHFKDKINEVIYDKNYSDYKSQLQEYFQSIKKELDLKYIVDKEEGPDHDKMFFVHVEESNVIRGKGCGKSKKEAEQNAAKECLSALMKER